MSSRRCFGGAVLAGIGLAAGCAHVGKEDAMTGSFGRDLDFLKRHTDAVALSDSTGRAMVIVVPKMQGRVMTSTAEGLGGQSFGWIHHAFIEKGKTVPHINVFGGEDRFWLGPEGGQFAIFFRKGVPFDLDHWFTPAAIDTEPFDVVSSDSRRLALRKDMTLENYAGETFRLRVDREVRVLEVSDALRLLGVPPHPSLRLVAYESVNRITNTGSRPWDKSTGLLSVWILGMYNPSPSTTVAIPFQTGSEAELGPIVNDAYFGKVPADRLRVGKGALFFRADGARRGKIGLSPQRAKPALGSYDAASRALTLVQYTKPEGAADYVNSMWEIQKEPFRGDVVNSYNDGPPAPGAPPLGPFYELETSSPAAPLAPGQSLTHVHRTFHMLGDEGALDTAARAVLGIALGDIKEAFPR